MAYRVITIGREYGSGGRLIGQAVAQTLNIPFYDKELIALTARDSGLAEEYVRQAEQKRTSSFFYSLYVSTQTLPASDQVFLAQCRTIQRLARTGPCVIVGRCADYALRERTDCLNVFFHAPLEDRLRRAEKEYGDNVPNLAAFVSDLDKKRASYYSYYTQRKWGDPHNFHVTLNSAIGLDRAAALLCHLAAAHEGDVEP